MKKIKLTQGKYAIIDDEDYRFLNKFKWHFANNKDKDYLSCVVTSVTGTMGINNSVQMSKFLLPSNKKGSSFRVFHKNGNLLDYRKKNLMYQRIGVIIHNAPKRTGKYTSEFKGVYYDKKYCRYRAYITKNYKRIWLGSFDTEVEAVKAYNEKARELHGEFAYQNKV